MRTRVLQEPMGHLEWLGCDVSVVRPHDRARLGVSAQLSEVRQILERLEHAAVQLALMF